MDDQGEIALVIDFNERDNSACLSSYSIHSQNLRLSEADIAGLYVSASTIPDISLCSQLAFLPHSEIHTTNMYSTMKASIVQPDNRDTDEGEDYDGENEADLFMEVKASRKGVIMKKKYKPVALKVHVIIAELPERFCIVRDIIGDPLAEMPTVDPNPPPYEPTRRYTQE
jgi:hypothetical protein